MTQNENQIELPGKPLLMVFGQVFPLEKKITTIGREMDNNLVLQNSLISRYHAEIRYEESEYVLYDLESTAGTSVNGEKIRRQALFSGDTILLAQDQLIFLLATASLTDLSGKETTTLGEHHNINNLE